MDERLQLRRALYGTLPHVPRRWRRAVRRQIKLLDLPGDGPSGGGTAGVREPRRTPPTAGPARQALESPP